MIAADYLSNEFEEGDYVIFMEPNYRSLAFGEVIRITEKQCQIKFKNLYGRETTFRTPHNCVVRLTKEQVFLKLL